MEVDADSETRDSQRRSGREDPLAPDSDAEKVGIRDFAGTSNGDDPKSNESVMAASSSRFSYGAISSTSRYKLLSPAKLPISRSPFLTIPPGLSPSSLLDSPVLLSNLKVEPSPTTGSLPKLLRMKWQVGAGAYSYAMHSSNATTSDERNPTNFSQPHHTSSLGSGFASSGSMAPTGIDFLKCEPFVEDQDQGLPQSLASSVTAPKSSVQMFTTTVDLPAEIDTGKSQQSQDSDILVEASQSDHREASTVVSGEKSVEDGYNWRKYGQKHVKGSEFPRSYYKCTHPNCQVKKQVERSYDGKITEIIYKGQHDHPKPQPRRRFPVGSVLSMHGENLERFSSFTKTVDKTSNAYGQTSYHTEPNGTSELIPVTASDDEDDDDNDDYDPDLKRRRQDLCNADVIPLFKPTREPRVVVQTLSEVDILDDGYRWRKYGQKVVKGNPNPRSYYKCTNAKCPVRKLVERASHDLNAVITTYEGKHNHDVPAARTASHDNAGPSTNATSVDAISRTRVEENDVISLDLGVGMTSSPQNGTNETRESDGVTFYVASSNLSKVVQTTPVPACSDRYVMREHQACESFSFKVPDLDHSSNPFPQSIGHLVIGP